MLPTLYVVKDSKRGIDRIKMKKLIFIFLSLFFLTGCIIYQKIPVYEKSYTSREEALVDAYWWLDGYKADSVPLEDWLKYQSYTDNGYLIERIFQQVWDEKTEMIVTLTTCICDSTTYHLLVLMRTRDRNQKQF